MFEDVAALRPLREAAELLARKDTWPVLYDPATLADTSIPVVAASYVEDMYVDWNLAQDTVKHVKGLRQWSTSEYMHRCDTSAYCCASLCGHRNSVYIIHTAACEMMGPPCLTGCWAWHAGASRSTDTTLLGQLICSAT